ncbi:MAG: endopeptidase La [Oscillospiraceae bacterium]|nr:endopeptidase La [Oscillospiraceae bacterium]
MEEKFEEMTGLRMPMIALRGLVVFPRMVLHFDVARKRSVSSLNKAMKQDRMVFLVAQKEVRDEVPQIEDLHKVGVVAVVKQVLKTADNNLRVVVEGKYRATLKEVVENENSSLEAITEEFPMKPVRANQTAMLEALARTVKELFGEYSGYAPKMAPEFVSSVMTCEDPAYLAEYLAQHIPVDYSKKQQILAESTVKKRLEMICDMLENENQVMGLEREIYDKVKAQMDKNHRDYYLREQIKVINNELGDNDDIDEEIRRYEEKIAKLKLNEECTEKLKKEVDRLKKMPSNGHEAAVIRGYLDTCLELPWNTVTKDKIDVVKAKAQLDKDHYGMEKVKERIIESLAVRKLAPDVKGQIICLVGPPGVGKTSVARSIAKAIGRNYVRLSLGGVRDESDIRGHRKTYIGAMPGRIMNAMKQAGSRNPLLLLDEIDKLGSDFKGDPSSALLEVLDAEQNYAFRDHYIELPFDLSEVLFIATANNAQTIPAPLYDRMEIIDLSSYTREEKFNIAKNHLVPKQLKKHGLDKKMMKFTTDGLYALIDGYTREAGVRTLERRIASVCRKAAKQIVAEEITSCKADKATVQSLLGPWKYKPDELETKDTVGVVNGLAWTSVGGEILQAEIAVLEGSGKLELTGSLGDVMKESAKTAVTCVRGLADKYGIDKEFYKTKDIHIHFPEGAVPKDGPSAGVTITTALVSALTNIPVSSKVAMTGEVTLRGRVLAIGGLKEKSMAAYRQGIKTVIIPKANLADLHDISPVVRDAITFVPAEDISTVLECALVKPKEEQQVADIELTKHETTENTGLFQ